MRSFLTQSHFHSHCNITVWEELIPKGKGLKTVYDRPGLTESDYNFSAEMLEEMILELNRLISKYGSSPWNTKITANKVVSLLTEHRGLVQEELDEVLSGRRLLTEKDFLGPKERERRRLAAGKANEEDQKDYSRYFFEMDQKLLEIRRTEMMKSFKQKRKEVEEAAKET